MKEIPKTKKGGEGNCFDHSINKNGNIDHITLNVSLICINTLQLGFSFRRSCTIHISHSSPPYGYSYSHYVV